MRGALCGWVEPPLAGSAFGAGSGGRDTFAGDGALSNKSGAAEGAAMLDTEGAAMAEA